MINSYDVVSLIADCPCQGLCCGHLPLQVDGQLIHNGNVEVGTPRNNLSSNGAR